jgi:hypothetical protein
MKDWKSPPMTEDDYTMTVLFADGEPCDHPGCLCHVSHPCEGCGRLGGAGDVVTTTRNFKARGTVMIELKCRGCGKVLSEYKEGDPLCPSCLFRADNSLHLRREDEAMPMVTRGRRG